MTKRTVYLKSCPRCKGDLIKDSDTYGVFMSCVQCGYDAAPLVMHQEESKKQAGVDFDKGMFKMAI